MQAIDVSFTSGYSIGLAIALNPKNPSRPMRAAAELWHLLCWKYNDLRADQRVIARDGFFYVGAKWFENFTGYNRRTFTEACKTLQQAGLIECKRMYALGTSTSYNHFKLLYSSWELAPENEYFVKGACTKSENPNRNPLPVEGQEVGRNSYNKEENKEEHIKDSLDSPASPTTLALPDATATLADARMAVGVSRSSSLLGASPASPARTASKGKTGSSFGVESERSEDSPFLKKAAPARCVRPSAATDKNATVTRRNFAAAKEVRELLKLPTNKIDPRYAKAVGEWLDAGLRTIDIVEADHMLSNINDEYHNNLTPLGKLSANNRDWYIQQKNKQNKAPRGAW